MYSAQVFEIWWEYVRRVSGNAMQKDIAKKVQVDPATITGWSKGRRPLADQVVAFARAYHRPRAEALIVANYLDPDEDFDKGAIEIETSLDDVSDAAMLDKLAERLAAYRELLTRHDAKDWPPAGWGHENPGVGGVENRNSRG